ncbi:bifunctional metallophosphatase/5'-nucleotidase [Duganella sp. FT80W]|uniref:Bifunctional metallophosphatase/5'-nucleotidase n=1 Tax=Duganella guangzhouensis TaxID=2666084 RepID=A0A6I2KZG5_9BURK|nr:bifunctional metallophosphatase/5'-nucleotidase [Duganella guangzhouensis]MRW91575.1 bifunctional metallophosphatase/5'-nucleotidase [Duganella guangzhouensis]
MHIPHTLSTSLLLAFGVTLAGCASKPPALPAGVTEVQLVAVNDFHGNLEASKYTLDSAAGGGERVITAGGIDTLGAALQAWRKQDPELLLVGAGDLVGASPAISSMWADEPTIGAMNLLGLRATSVGNHEFDQGRIELLRQQTGGCKSPRADKACKFDGSYQGAQFQYLAANVIDMTTRKPVLPAYKIETAHGVKIAFIGTVLKETAEASLASGIAGLEFVDEADAINRQLPELRKQGVGVFVVLIHQGGRTTDKFDQQDCAHLEGPIVDVVKRLDPAIRLVISGHSHQGYLCKVDGRLVTQSDMGGHLLGRIKLTVDTNTNSVRDVSAKQEVMVPGTWPADPALDAYLKKARARSEAALAQPVATIAVPSVKRDKDHKRESALGDLVADSMLYAGRPYGAQIALQNPGGIRQDLETSAGNRVTLGQAMAVLPFGNALVVMNLRGAQIVELLEQQWLDNRDSKRGLLQVSEGFSYEYDAMQPEGSRVVPGSVKLNGVPLDPNGSYRVMTNNFLAEGGDGFPGFTKGSNRAPTGIRDLDAFTEYLAKREQDLKPAGAAAAQARYKEK